ncbi:uncharacterized protein BDW70DRAFT_72608 [Aspergillus foveolatus]|uniref:uncharacterized protein n=1 Tax=Aspergillus foveolatus TaxID=210207 RepID=UPI003CCDB82C
MLQQSVTGDGCLEGFWETETGSGPDRGEDTGPGGVRCGDGMKEECEKTREDSSSNKGHPVVSSAVGRLDNWRDADTQRGEAEEKRGGKGTRRYARLFKCSHSSRSNNNFFYLVSSLSLAGSNPRLEMTNIDFSNSLRIFEETRKSDQRGGDARRGEWLSSDA